MFPRDGARSPMLLCLSTSPRARAGEVCPVHGKCREAFPQPILDVLANACILPSSPGQNICWVLGASDVFDQMRHRQAVWVVVARTANRALSGTPELPLMSAASADVLSMSQSTSAPRRSAMWQAPVKALPVALFDGCTGCVHSMRCQAPGRERPSFHRMALCCI